MRGLLLAVVLMLVVLAGRPSTGVANVGRYALVIGNNRGVDPTRTLQYAERDATRVAAVLDELCDVPRSNLELLIAARPRQVLAAVDRLAVSIATADHEEGGPTVLYVFFSGHSDGVDLELGDERLRFSRLREALDATSADLKVVFVDSCRSGAFASQKGGTPAPEFDVRLIDSLDTNGTAVIASASSSESAQESEPVQGSYFTHHLLSGLQGAADRNGDDRVTLSEVYEYAYNQTVTGSLLTLRGPQHPTFDYSLSGRGDVVMADLTRSDAALRFSSPARGTYWVIEDASHAVVAEVDKPAGAQSRLALPQGHYLVAQRSEGRVLVQSVDLARGDEVVIAPEYMTVRDVDLVSLKGASRRKPLVEVFAHYGLSSGTFHTMGVLHQANLGVRLDAGPFSFFPRVVYGDTSIDTDGLRYRVQQVGAEGYATVRVDLQRLDMFFGVNLGFNWSHQRLVNGETHSGTTAIGGVVAGLDLPLWSRLALQLFWEVDAHVLRVNGVADGSVALKGAVGLAWMF